MIRTRNGKWGWGSKVCVCVRACAQGVCVQGVCVCVRARAYVTLFGI